MTINSSRTIRYSQYWKGFHNGKTSCYDQIATGFGKTGIENRSRGLANIFGSSQPTRFHTSPDICYPRTSPVLQDRLSRHNQNPARTSKYQKCSWSDQASSLYHTAKGSAEDVKKTSFRECLQKFPIMQNPAV